MAKKFEKEKTKNDNMNEKTPKLILTVRSSEVNFMN